MKSRFGSYSGGEKKVLTDGNLISPSAFIIYPSNTDLKVFSYTNSKGIWDLDSTNEFPSETSRVVTSGLTTPLFVKGYSWDISEQNYIQYTVNIARYANKSARVVFRLDTNGFDFSDYQIDLVNLSGNIYDFENTGHSWQTTTTNTLDYNTATWTTLAVGTTNVRWNVDLGGTPTPGASSTLAANGSYYVYAETTGSSGYSYYMWLRSPVVALGANPTLSFYLCRFQSGPYITAHLDIQ